MHQQKNLPIPPSLRKTLGPSFILLGLALGSGELILWPYLAARYGLGLLWGALLGISFQFVLNTEIMRYTLYRGESVFVGFKRLHRLLPAWFIFSTVVPWSIPGFSSASANILHHLIPELSEKWVAIFLLLITGVFLSLGKSLYQTMEAFQKFVIMLGLPLIVLLTIWLSSRHDWLMMLQGLVGKGENWYFFPPAVAITAFLGAFAYAGAGGNLNLAQSYYIKEKGFGMGKYMSKISTLFSRKEIKSTLTGYDFPKNKFNKRRWFAWWQLVNQEHLIVFFGLGFVTIALLSVLAYTTVFSNFGLEIKEGITFLYFQSEVISTQTTPILGTGFLLVAALMLFSTQVGVLESAARITSENLALLIQQPQKSINLSRWFYIALWAEILVGIFLYAIGLTEPRFLITLSAILNAAAMMMSFVLIQILNRKELQKAYRPNRARRAIIGLAVLFFLYFLTLTILNA